MRIRTEIKFSCIVERGVGGGGGRYYIWGRVYIKRMKKKRNIIMGGSRGC